MPLLKGFVGRLGTEEGMRPPLVVPFEEASDRGPEIPASQRDVKQSCAFVFESTDEAFDHRDASLLADGTEAGLDLCGLAPAFETIAPELATLVGDDVLGLGTVLLDRAIQEFLNGPGSRLLSEDHESHGAA
jgi:hypothetical protein